MARVSQSVIEAVAHQCGWRERARAGLKALLAFLDEQPSWARFLLLEPPVAAPAVFERRQRALAELARAIERETQRQETRGQETQGQETQGQGTQRQETQRQETQRQETQGQAARYGRLAPSPRLTADLVVGGVFAVIQGRMHEAGAKSFGELAPSLTAFVVGSYRSAGAVDAAKLPVRTTYRTARVLSAIHALPRPNNREIAEAAGLRDEGQTSKLLSRLEQRGLVENVGLGAAYGEPNAWLLTAAGERVLDTTSQFHALDGRRSRGSIVGGAA